MSVIIFIHFFTHLFTKQTHYCSLCTMPKRMGSTSTKGLAHGACHPQRPRHSQKNRIQAQGDSSEQEQATAGCRSASNDPSPSPGSPSRLTKKSFLTTKWQTSSAPAPKHGGSHTCQAKGGNLQLLSNPRDAAERTSPS